MHTEPVEKKRGRSLTNLDDAQYQKSIKVALCFPAFIARVDNDRVQILDLDEYIVGFSRVNGIRHLLRLLRRRTEINAQIVSCTGDPYCVTRNGRAWNWFYDEVGVMIRRTYK